ncbi:MotE family protein [Rhizobium sp. CFBP 8762]|uniref:MotE family protein n=1 Tax=Rhizobium sp. CFBP 8762 TaxID=2775279 RepID=UPI0017837D9D|nr:MotE family protein [Rhizobium sp. CFBP 8762]MBD8553462.1 MotE family protein [Rhizobium sp. CFBP 8762]
MKKTNHLYPALIVALLGVPGAFAQTPATTASDDEIRTFCTNIADAARDQRYLLQKKELDDLRVSIDERIATLEKRRAEYEEWLKRRDEFLKRAEAGLVDIYKNMPPDAAAGQLALVKEEVAAAIVMQLSPRLSSVILSEMKPDRAAALASIISSAGDPNTSKDPS